MSNNTIDNSDLAKAHVPEAVIQGTAYEAHAGRGSIDVGKSQPLYEVRTPETEEDDDTPTEDDLQNLRRISGKIKWAAYTVAFVELAERFSYYGSSILYTNFVQWPLPEGSRTGAGGLNGQPGALGMGQSAAQGISLFNQFFAYFMPLVGGYIADAHLGRYKTIHIAIVIGIVAHIILVAASAPDVIVNKTGSTAAFIIGLLTLCVGTGFFKANISPLLAEQNPTKRMHVQTLPTGERVIVDPAITNSRIFLYFYLCVNIGSLTGQISMVYVLPYVFIGTAEIFTNVTSLEYAYAKAPANMKSLVMSINLFMSAFASAIGQAFTPLSQDPLLVWNYTIITILAFLGGVGFWFCFRDLDANEDRLNMLEISTMRNNNTAVEPSDTEAQVQHVHDEKK
ncbi:PTR2-domain-containing protein [Aureobasidium subglaciale]|nr:PTR2-domain-containing protein [Aureobasidium subglaciale]